VMNVVLLRHLSYNCQVTQAALVGAGLVSSVIDESCDGHSRRITCVVKVLGEGCYDEPCCCCCCCWLQPSN
jgi:hypothetical protein